MKNKMIILLSLLLLAFNASAEIDPFNVYQYKQGSKTPWFEWWYYKVIIPETKESFFFVYGVVNPWDTNNQLKGTRAYTMMGDFVDKKIIENKVPLDQFVALYDQTHVSVGNNLGTDIFFNGDLKDENGNQYSWDVSIQKDWSYNATGWATGKGITDIEWYPAQASARCSGSIVSNNKLYQFTNAPCYQDRNWGKSFPLWWTWIVSNKFKENPDSVLAIGGGRPKYHNTKFPLEGASVGLKHKGIEYHFRPNDLDKVVTNVSYGKWEIIAENETQKLEVVADAPKDDFLDIPFMTPTGEMFHDYETLTGNVVVKIYKKKFFKWILIDTLTSEYAGIEYGSPKASY